MLGKLFNLAAGANPSAAATADEAAASQPVSSLESVQEDMHTRDLLFPDAQSLYQHRNDQVFPLSAGAPIPQAAGAFDYDADIDLDARDVRVIIMQDALSSVPALLLYDSQAPPPTPTSPLDRPSNTAPQQAQDPRRIPLSPRKPSLSHASRPLVIQPDSPQPRQGAFDRRPSVHGRNQPRVESESQRAHREYSDELAVLSSCIFGNSELLAYKGTSTKVHVVPSDSRSDLAVSVAGDGRGSLGRSSTRSSKLSQSFSSETASPFSAAPTSAGVSRSADRKKVLITRLFPVALPSDDDASNPRVTPQSRFAEDGAGYPFPQYGEESKLKKGKPHLRQKRTPMYAISLVVNLPQNTPGAVPAAKPTFRGPSSYTEQDSFPSSYGSAKRSGWTMVGPMFGADSFDSAYGTDVEDRIDAITQHWDIIMRTLTHLQSVVATSLFAMLKHADIVSPDPLPSSVTSHLSRTPSLTGRRSEDGMAAKPPKTNAKIVLLNPHCLMGNDRITGEVDIARTRVVTGLRATRVVTGQNRWGIWRDEARWVSRWAGGKEQGPFFFNVLTGFLATHTDWLQALSPPWYRQRHFLQQKAKGEEDMALPARTIIVAQDKMAARRLIFLLCAFLPALQQLPNLRTHRPSTSASWGAFSQSSPPSYVVPLLREESLRRKINRRAGPRRSSHSRNVSSQGQQGSRSFAVPGQLAHLSMDRGHERRPSDAASIRTSNLPISGSEFNTRKSSAATTTTITPETSMPHFAMAHKLDSPLHARPGSANSVAADDLKRTLKRGDSTSQYSVNSTDSRQGSRWGSVISGLWSARRRDSTNSSVPTADSPNSRRGSGPEPLSPTKRAPRKSGSLSKMVREAQLTEPPSKDQPPTVEDADPQTPRLPDDRSNAPTQQVRLEPTQRTPDPSGAFESPVKTSINIEDGVIDVDVPFPDYITSFETAVSSPSSSGYLSTPGFGSGLDAFEQSCRVNVDGDVVLNVAGWLQRYHPDFALQAVPPQEDLEDQVRASMRAEPSPSMQHGYSMSGEPQHERWLDISSVVIADTTTFTIKRLRYRRLVRPKPMQDRKLPLLSGSVNTHGSSLLTPAICPYEIQLEDEFIEEPVATLDDVLIEAIERVIAQSSDVSKGSSSCSSRSASIRRDRSNSESTEPDEPRLLRLPAGPQEVPRGECKVVVLSALEEIAREVASKKDSGPQGGEDGAQEGESFLRGAVRTWLESVELGE